MPSCSPSTPSSRRAASVLAHAHALRQMGHHQDHSNYRQLVPQVHEHGNQCLLLINRCIAIIPPALLPYVAVLIAPWSTPPPASLVVASTPVASTPSP
eukprot:943610-Pelagomonas_calceolata.AAC.1